MVLAILLDPFRTLVLTTNFILPAFPHPQTQAAAENGLDASRLGVKEGGELLEFGW